MNILEALQFARNHDLALKTANDLLDAYGIGLEGCQDDNEKEELRKAFSDILSSQI